MSLAGPSPAAPGEYTGPAVPAGPVEYTARSTPAGYIGNVGSADYVGQVGHAGPAGTGNNGGYGGYGGSNGGYAGHVGNGGYSHNGGTYDYEQRQAEDPSLDLANPEHPAQRPGYLSHASGPGQGQEQRQAVGQAIGQAIGPGAGAAPRVGGQATTLEAGSWLPSQHPVTLTRIRSVSASDSSLLRPSGIGSAGGDYPEGWSKEDEEAEREFVRKGMVDWRGMRRWRFWIRKEWWGWYLALVLIATLVILMTVYHDQIVTWLKPAADWMKDLPGGFMIPIVILFVISFPPLFGHEIVTIIIGVVWGLWWGFLITAIGTFLGEVGNYFAFKYCCRSRAEKFERDNMNYATLAHVVREGGFFIVFVARLSAIPGHFTTAVFSTCGVNIWVFSLATILTLPKQLVVVYLGVIFGQDESTSTKNRIISYAVLGIGFAATCLAAWYIYHKMNQARVVVWRRQRMALAGKRVSGGVIDLSGSSLKEYPAEMNKLEDAEAANPILGPYRTYQNPYDINYHAADNMSVDDIDSTVPLRPAGESDLGYGYRPADSVEQFPQPQPAFPTGQVPQRALTSASTWSTGGGAVDYAAFPVPNPVSALGGAGGASGAGGAGIAGGYGQTGAYAPNEMRSSGNM